MKSIISLLLIAFALPFVPTPYQEGGASRSGGSTRDGGGTSCISGQVASDTFAGSALSASWTTTNGGFGVSSNAVFPNVASTQQSAYYNAATLCPNQYATLNVNTGTSNDFVGPACRVQTGANQLYRIVWSTVGTAQTLELEMENGASETVLASPTSDLVAGDVIRINCGPGTTISCSRNGTQITGCTATDSQWTSGRGGLAGFGSSAGTDPSGKSWAEGNQ